MRLMRRLYKYTQDKRDPQPQEPCRGEESDTLEIASLAETFWSDLEILS